MFLRPFDSKRLRESYVLFDSLSFRKRKGGPGIDTEGDDEHRLHCMYDKYEIECVFIDDAIENQHGLDGEVPGTCSVGGGHDDGDGAYYKRYQRTGQSKMLRSLEAEEGQVIM